MPSFDVDLFCIGAGSGGTRAARIAAGYGARVAVAEEYRFGGTCVIRGCVPKKLYVYASRFHDAFAEASGFGWHDVSAKFDWAKLVEAKEKEISRLSGLYEANLRKAGVTLHGERATLLGPHDVQLASGQKISAGKILIATGARPHLGTPVPGQELALTSNEIFDLPALPRSLVIVGGGYIALEFASIFVRLGVAVDVVMRGPTILRGFDAMIQNGLHEALAAAGVRFHFGTLPSAIIRTAQGGVTVQLGNGATLAADHIMIATGRHPNVAGLGLEALGVAMRENGAIQVDTQSRSSVPSIFAVGDVTDRINLTPVAIREGHAFADTQFGGKDVVVDHDLVASAVFTTPEAGSVGLTEAQALTKAPVLNIFETSFRPMKATLSGLAERVMMKIIVDAASDRVLGVHILGPEAGEMVQLLAISLKLGAKKADFDATMAVHPTAAEELVTMRSVSRVVRA